MKKNIKIDENMLRGIVNESIKRVLSERYGKVEDYEIIPLYQVFTENVSLSEIPKILEEDVYDKNDNFVGKMKDLCIHY